MATPNLETASGTTTQSQSVAERTRVRLPESEAEGAPPVRKTRTTPTVPVTTTAETMATTTPTARALVERVGDEAGEDSQPVQMRRIAALMAECEDACTSEAIAEARRVHLEKLTKVKDAVIKVVPRTDATTKHHARRRSTEGQVDDAWIRANSERKRGLLLSNASDDAPQDDVGRGSSERACCGNRRLQRGLLPVTSEPRWNGESSLDRSASRGRAGTRVHLGSRVSFPALKGAPRAWDSYSAGVLTNSMQMKQSQYDGCLFYRFEQERIEEKAGRHIDDFLVTARTERRTLSGTGTRQAEHAGCSAVVQNRRRR